MKHNNGFSLIEVLVTVLLLSTGLLGLVGLQTAAMKNTLSSYNRTQATHFAYSMADRIRSNRADAELFSTSTYIAVAPTDAVKTDKCLTTEGCPPAEMAGNDLKEWNDDLTDTANGMAKTGTIIVCKIPYDGLICNVAVTGDTAVFVITISWREGRDNDNDGLPDITSFQTEFQL